MAVVTFVDLHTESGLKTLEEYLSEKTFISGDQISKDDVKVFGAVPQKPSAGFPNTARWYDSVESVLAARFPGQAVGVSFGGQAASSAPVPTQTPKENAGDDDDDDLDLFGDETEEDKKAAADREAAVKASSKKKESGKSSVLLDVKPWDDETDMKKLEETVRGIEMPGLLWGASKLVAVGYGIKKLQIMMTIVDDLVSALPQGTMAPVNSFNTLVHSQAFWGLMLPVSVSSMASDVLRGYWAQRILWEIGGFVAVYPPTIHRVDNVQSYPFAEEKDLHVNVGRLIKFLVSWRSNKPTLFERILHLSYAMAEEGFWTELDVRFTAAWLQDLLSIGYQQPRLMSLELDRPRATIGHGDRREFVPKKLPSVHLGVEEVGTVNYEIGNLIRWRKNFGNVVLVMYCTGPVERTALEWRLLYGRIFKTVIILAEQMNSDLVVEYGQLSHAYKYLPKVFNRYAGAEGFLFLQDDMILNYWNLLSANKEKLWITNEVPKSWVSVIIDGNSTKWYTEQAALVNQVVDSFPVHFQTNYKEYMGEGSRLTICGSEIFYVPQRHAADFADLVGLVGDLDIHHKVAVPMFFMAMDSPQSYDSEALSKIAYSAERAANAPLANTYSTSVPAVYPVDVRDETEFIKLVRVMAAGDPLLMELV